MKKLLILLLVLLPLSCFASGSELYPWPTTFSFNDLASWSQPLLASAAAAPNVASASEGDLYLNTTDKTIHRMESGAWAAYGGSGGGSGDTATITAAIDANSASITINIDGIAAHVASDTDPHGADMTVTSSVTVGSGTADTMFYRIGTGTIALASYTVILPNAATPSAIIATGTLWYDSNTSKLRCYDGAAWNDLY